MRKSLYLVAACVLLSFAQQLVAEDKVFDECLLTLLQGGVVPDVTGFSAVESERWIRQIKAVQDSNQHYINTRNTDLLLIDLGDEKTIENIICQLAGPPDDKRMKAAQLLARSRQPKLILKLKDLLNLEDPLEPVLFEGCFSISARPSYAQRIIQGVIQNFEGFSDDLKEWAKNSPKTREAEIVRFRKWLRSNEKALQEERWKEVKPI